MRSSTPILSEKTEKAINKAFSSLQQNKVIFIDPHVFIKKSPGKNKYLVCREINELNVLSLLREKYTDSDK